MRTGVQGLIIVALITILLLLTGCSNNDNKNADTKREPQPVVVVDAHKVINDGTELTYTLNSGTYDITITSDQPLNVNADYEKENSEAKEITNYTRTLKLNSPDNLHITNPTTFGMGPAANISIKVITYQ